VSGRKSGAALDTGWARPREREGMRAAILEAAKRLMERNGADTLTLSAVAAEVGIARATIYGYFSSKQELFSQVAAFEGSREPSPEADTPPESATAELAETPAAEGPEPAGRTAPQSEEPSGENYQALMKAQADALHQIARRVIVPRSLMKDGTDTVLSRVEARLSVAEQTTSALEYRLEQQAKELTSQTEAVTGTLQQLLDRMNAFERRQQEAVAELRLGLHNLTVKEQAAKEQPAKDDMRMERPADPADELSFVPVGPLTSEAEPEPERQAEAEPKPEQSPPVHIAEDYLSSARRAAINAAQIVAEEKKPPRQIRLPRQLRRLARFVRLPKLRIRNKRRVWQILGLAALGVVLFDVVVLAIYPPSASSHEAVAAPVPAKPLSLTARAARGDVQAQLALGMRLLNGTGVQTNVEKGAQWLERAAAAGQPVAQNFTGVLYQTGTGVSADMPKAVKWYEAAAEHGNVKAMANLGKLFAGGWPEGTNYTKAAHWFGRAAALGDLDAQFDLAVLYELGEGVQRSIPQAYKWYSVAAMQGDKNAAARAALLKARLMPDVLRIVQADIAAFKPGKIDRAANAVPPVSR